MLSTAIGKTKSITLILVHAPAIDWGAATCAEPVLMVQAFGGAITLGVQSCPVAVSQRQTQAVMILMT